MKPFKTPVPFSAVAYALKEAEPQSREAATALNAFGMQFVGCAECREAYPKIAGATQTIYYESNVVAAVDLARIILRSFFEAFWVDITMTMRLDAPSGVMGAEAQIKIRVGVGPEFMAVQGKDPALTILAAACYALDKMWGRSA